MSKALIALLLVAHSVHLATAGCNVQAVTTLVQDANGAAVNTVSKSLAECQTCPCNIKVSSEVRVVAETAANALLETSKNKLAGNCGGGSASADATATTDVASDLSIQIASAISKACGDVSSTAEADTVTSALQDAAAKADAAAASAGGATSSSASSLTDSLAGILAETITKASSKCKCKGGKNADNGVAFCPPGQAKAGKCGAGQPFSDASGNASGNDTTGKKNG